MQIQYNIKNEIQNILEKEVKNLNLGKVLIDPYKKAVEAGFSGTEEEFYAALSSIGDINAALDEINGEAV